MKLTRAGEYAIRCVLYLSKQNGDGVVKRREVAEAMDIPLPFLGKVAQLLQRADIIDITQGAGGGYRLARGPEAISLLDVVEAVDGPIVLNQCLLRHDSCSRTGTCSVHRVWGSALEGLRQTLAGADFARLAREG